VQIGFAHFTLQIFGLIFFSGLAVLYLCGWM
jgi:hypothetical protein